MASWCDLHRWYSILCLTTHYKPLAYPGLNAHNVLVNGLLPDNSTENPVCAVAMKHIGRQCGLYIRRQNESRAEKASSVLVTLPTSALKVVFCDDAVMEMLNAQSSSDSALLTIYLPHHFRLHTFKEESPAKPVPRLPLCISVTLVYPTPWWREFLSRAMESNTLSSQGQNVDLDAVPCDTKPPTFFSFIPDRRTNRGFCHTFRDLTPSVGALLNQILPFSFTFF